MSERSGDWGAGLSPGVGAVFKAGYLAKTMTRPINYTVRVMRWLLLVILLSG